MTTLDAPGISLPAARDLKADRRRLHGVARTQDVKARAKKAADLADEVTAYAQKLRTIRDQAATALRRNHGWTPVECYRLIGVTRELFAKIDSRNRRRGVDPAYAADGHLAKEHAAAAGELVAVWDELADQARLLRDTAILDLLTSGLRNVEIAEVTGMTEARIAQVKLPRPNMTDLHGIRTVVSPHVDRDPTPGEDARRQVRHGLADVLDWLGEEIGPEPGDPVHRIFLIGGDTALMSADTAARTRLFKVT